MLHSQSEYRLDEKRGTNIGTFGQRQRSSLPKIGKVKGQQCTNADDHCEQRLQKE